MDSYKINKAGIYIFYINCIGLHVELKGVETKIAFIVFLYTSVSVANRTLTKLNIYNHTEKHNLSDAGTTINFYW
jgi:hypothetical protein